MEKLVAFCRERDLPLVLVAFPYRSQLAKPEARSAPQQVLADFAQRHALSFLDLLPALSRAMRRAGLVPADLFLDHSHPTVRGSRIAARHIATFLSPLLDAETGSAKVPARPLRQATRRVMLPANDVVTSEAPPRRRLPIPE
jgi:hypothetical protein